MPWPAQQLARSYTRLAVRPWPLEPDLALTCRSGRPARLRGGCQLRYFRRDDPAHSGHADVDELHLAVPERMRVLALVRRVEGSATSATHAVVDRARAEPPRGSRSPARHSGTRVNSRTWRPRLEAVRFELRRCLLLHRRRTAAAVRRGRRSVSRLTTRDRIRCGRRRVPSRPIADAMPGNRGATMSGICSSRRDVGREHRAGAAERDEREVARVVAPCGRCSARWRRHVRRRNRGRCRRPPRRSTARAASAICSSIACSARRARDRHATAEEGRLGEPPEHELRVGHGGLGSALP